MEQIKWGIIGCGDVTEVKSGPAFNKVPDSTLVAVMRRDKEKVQDYAKRHGVSKWYTDANALINDPDVNAIYVATPPLQHEEYTIAALKANKPVYVEKPMTVNAEAAERILAAIGDKNKVSVAHYRRAQPIFLQLKQLVDSNAIGEIKYVELKYLHAPMTPHDLANPGKQWRVDPTLSGGGLFHDLAPHQIDLALFLFGKVKSASGLSGQQGKLYIADDIVSGSLLFDNGIMFQGLWSFNVPGNEQTDICTITGTEGKIQFSVFGSPEILITMNGVTEVLHFEKLQHLQQPMIDKVVQYFLGKGENPCPAHEGVMVMKILDTFTGIGKE